MSVGKLASGAVGGVFSARKATVQPRPSASTQRSVFGAQGDGVKHNPLKDQDDGHDTGVLVVEKGHGLLLAATKFDPRTSTWCQTIRMTSATMKITQPSAS